ncbi:hypothetical protein [Sinanaerobacter sp. ZZT-01]|uniref:hypothetical protein n=1 Tax=Sinanaerobacter sp. ZZT-01 TaxID=3111540 RepID=UPI002D78E2A0|nr:hypothetical protein [Sinanaerobacter sp. ZZT-01]WRR92726.1 hypothetical protein U5921_11815 [Sinanaerobacter sp. ZZT-01]
MKINKKIISSVLALMMMFSLGMTSVSAMELTQENLADTENLDTTAGTYNGEAYNEYSVDGSSGSIAAGSASSVIVLNAEATNFDVTIPIALRVNAYADGSITTPDSMSSTSKGLAKIINNCVLGQVEVVSAKINLNGWTATAFDADYANMKVNSKNIGFKINGLEMATDGTILANNTATDTISSIFDIDANTAGVEEFEDYSFTRSGSSPFPIIANGSVLPIEYSAKIPGLDADLINVVPGSIVITVDFYK